MIIYLGALKSFLFCLPVIIGGHRGRWGEGGGAEVNPIQEAAVCGMRTKISLIIFWFNFLYYQKKFFFVGVPEDTKNSFTEKRGESSKWINVLTFKDNLHVTK